MAGNSRPSGAVSKGGPAPKPKLIVAKPKRWPRRALVAINLLVLAMLVAGGSAYAYARWQLGKTNHVSVTGLVPVASDSSPMTILAVGSDTRNLGKGDSASFGNDASVTGQRSDTIMLVRVVPATSSVAIMSVPRDLLVNIAGMGTTRINSAFNKGPDLLISTIEQDLGIKVNHYMVVNFYSFTQIADSLGGVYQYFPTPARDLYSGLTVTTPGCVLLKGANALGFVRSREYQYLLDGQWQYQLSPESDLARIQRQQDFVKLALKKAEHIDPLNVVALNDVFSGITSSLTVDDSFSTNLMLKLAETFRHANVSGIAEWTYPTVNSSEVAGALDPDPAADQAMVQQFLKYGQPPATSSPSALGRADAPSGTQQALSPLRSSPGSRRSAASASVALAVDLWSDASAVGTTTPQDQITPSSSSFYQGQYIPPGLRPGQVPEQCPS